MRGIGPFVSVGSAVAHVVVPEAEEILDLEFRVLDKGFVRLVDYLGGDARIVQAARVSYGAGTKSVREDKALIHYLMKNAHTSPFEQVQLTFHVKLPIFVARQWIRHRTARLNEISGRYSVLKDEFYVPEPGDVRPQSARNKQGRADQPVTPETAKKVLDMLMADQERAYSAYQKILADDVARELARINLPVSLYTEWYWQIDLHNLFHFLRLRADAHAQEEIRVYAMVMLDIARRVAPAATEAFEEHVMHGVSLSRTELTALRKILAGQPHGLDEKAHLALREKLGLSAEATAAQT